MDMLEKGIYGPSIPMIVEALRRFGAIPAGSREYSFLEIHDLLCKGIPWSFAFRIKRKTELDDGDISAFLGISPRTFQRARHNKRKRMSRNVSEHALRLAVVVLAANDLLDGDESSAVEWLKSPAFRLAGRVPLEVAVTGIGANEVLNVMGRIEWGIPP